jgi:hypothetical protein
VREISIEEFDKRSEELLFGKLCSENFAPLFSYPQSKLKIKYLEDFWE